MHWKHEQETSKRNEVIRETAGVDPSILVADIGLSAPHIRAYQRRLGVRKITGNPAKKK